MTETAGRTLSLAMVPMQYVNLEMEFTVPFQHLRLPHGRSISGITLDEISAAAPLNRVKGVALCGATRAPESLRG